MGASFRLCALFKSRAQINSDAVEADHYEEQHDDCCRRSRLEASFQGADVQVAFNPEFLMAGLDLATGDTVTLQTTDPLKPALLRSPDRPDYLYLLMPVRVS